MLCAPRQAAYAVLSAPARRADYDAERVAAAAAGGAGCGAAAAEEEGSFEQQFRGGAFADGPGGGGTQAAGASSSSSSLAAAGDRFGGKGLMRQLERNEQPLVVAASKEGAQLAETSYTLSHTEGFDAWLRNHKNASTVMTGDELVKRGLIEATGSVDTVLPDLPVRPPRRPSAPLACCAQPLSVLCVCACVCVCVGGGAEGGERDQETTDDCRRVMLSPHALKCSAVPPQAAAAVHRLFGPLQTVAAVDPAHEIADRCEHGEVLLAVLLAPVSDEDAARAGRALGAELNGAPPFNREENGWVDPELPAALGTDGQSPPRLLPKAVLLPPRCHHCPPLLLPLLPLLLLHSPRRHGGSAGCPPSRPMP